MPEELTPELKQEIAVGNANATPTPDEPRDIRELIAMEKAKTQAEETPTEEKKKKAPLTDEDMAKVTDLLGQQLQFRRNEEKKAAPEAKTEKTDPKAEDKVEAKPEEKAEEKPKKVTTRKKQEFDPAQIAADAAASAARQVAETLKPREAAKPAAQDPTAGLTPDEREELAVFQEMERMDPARQGISSQYIESIKKIESYRQSWERENPDKTFDPEDETHDAFYERTTPRFTEREFRKAEARLAGREQIKELESKTQAEQAALKSELAEKELEPVIIRTKIQAAAAVLKSINPEMLTLVEKEGFARFAETDPVAADALSISAQRLSHFIEAARQIDEPKARIPINLKNPAHAEYINYLVAKEDEMKARPPRDQVDEDGRLFATRTELLSMPPAQRRRFWFYNDELLIQARVTEEAALAKQFVQKDNERLEKLAKSRGWTTPSASKGSQEKPAKTEEKAAKPNSSTDKSIQSPEAGSGGKVDATVDGGKKVDGDFFDRSAAILFRR